MHSILGKDTVQIRHVEAFSAAFSGVSNKSFICFERFWLYPFALEACIASKCYFRVELNNWYVRITCSQVFLMRSSPVERKYSLAGWLTGQDFFFHWEKAHLVTNNHQTSLTVDHLKKHKRPPECIALSRPVVITPIQTEIGLNTLSSVLYESSLERQQPEPINPYQSADFIQWKGKNPQMNIFLTTPFHYQILLIQS